MQALQCKPNVTKSVQTTHLFILVDQGNLTHCSAVVVSPSSYTFHIDGVVLRRCVRLLLVHVEICFLFFACRCRSGGTSSGRSKLLQDLRLTESVREWNSYPLYCEGGIGTHSGSISQLNVISCQLSVESR